MKCILNKKLNSLIFLGELSGLREGPWNNERRIDWIKHSGGKLTNKEKEGIHKFTNIFSNINYSYFEAYFVAFSGKKLNKQIIKILGKSTSADINNILDSFLPRFERIWEKEKICLEKIEKFFKKEKPKINETIKIIEKISGSSGAYSQLKNIPIHLTLSGNNRNDAVGWFSLLDKKTDLVLECSRNISQELGFFLVLIIIHELFHVALRKNIKLMKEIKKIATDNSEILSNFSNRESSERTLEELLISTFAPEGYFRNFFDIKKIERAFGFKRNKHKISFVSVRRLCAYKMADISACYAQKGEGLNTKYILRLVKEIKSGWHNLSATR